MNDIVTATHVAPAVGQVWRGRTSGQEYEVIGVVYQQPQCPDGSIRVRIRDATQLCFDTSGKEFGEKYIFLRDGRRAPAPTVEPGQVWRAGAVGGALAVVVAPGYALGFWKVIDAENGESRGEWNLSAENIAAGAFTLVSDDIPKSAETVRVAFGLACRAEMFGLATGRTSERGHARCVRCGRIESQHTNPLAHRFVAPACEPWCGTGEVPDDAAAIWSWGEECWCTRACANACRPLNPPAAPAKPTAVQVGQRWRDWKTGEEYTVRARVRGAWTIKWASGGSGQLTDETAEEEISRDTYLGMAKTPEPTGPRRCGAAIAGCNNPKKGHPIAECYRGQPSATPSALVPAKPATVEAGQRWRDPFHGEFSVAAPDRRPNMWWVYIGEPKQLGCWTAHGILACEFLGMGEVFLDTQVSHDGQTWVSAIGMTWDELDTYTWAKEGGRIVRQPASKKADSADTPSAAVPVYLRRPDPNRAVEEYQKLLNGLTAQIWACNKPIHNARGHVVAFCNLVVGHSEEKCEWHIDRAPKDRGSLSVGYRFEPALDARPAPHAKLPVDPWVTAAPAADIWTDVRRRRGAVFTADQLPPAARLERPARYPEVTEDDLLPDV